MLEKLLRLLSKLLKKLLPPPLIQYHFEPWALQEKLFKNQGDSCFDISYGGDDYVLKPGEIRLFETGLRVELPEDFEIQVRSRSGLAAKNGIFVLNSPGTIDESYRGEIKVILANLGKEDFKIERGMRIAQLFFNQCDLVRLKKVDVITQNTERNSNGFGSTGLH